MPFERWGSLSVADHIDTGSLMVNVLLYDRLVFPVMTEQADRDERAYWREHNWDPDLQSERLDLLEDLAVRRPWDQHRRAQFKTRAAEIAAEQREAQGIDKQHLTRMILAQEQVIERVPGVNGVTVVAAYNSISALQRDFSLGPASRDRGVETQAWLLGRQLFVPDLDDPEDALREAVRLSRDGEFQSKRSDLFDWQNRAAAEGMNPADAVVRISDMTDRYNECVKRAFARTRLKFAFTVFGCALGFVTGGVGVAAASAGLSLLGFALLDGKPAVEPGSARPVAMFHDLQRHFGMRL